MALSLADIHHLDEARGWLDLGGYEECWDALERVEWRNRGTEEEAHIRWHLYQKTKQYVPAANYALGIQRRWPDKMAGYVWRSISLEKLACYQDAYENLEPVADKFQGTGIVAFLLGVYACELGRMETARDWLKRAFDAPEGKELKLRALDEPKLETFWRKIGKV